MTIEKQAASIIWTGHDGMFQLTVAVHGGRIETYTMSPETFYRQFGRQAELVASKVSGVGRTSCPKNPENYTHYDDVYSASPCPNLDAIRNPG